MTRRKLFGVWLAVLVAVSLVVAACGSPAAQPEPTKAPAAPTTAPAAEATKAPAADPAKAPSAEPTKAQAAGSVAKPANYPTKPVQVIVPWNAGGSTDVGFRMVTPVMEKIIGQQVQIVNKPGAGSQVGITELAMAKNDGYTIGNVSAPATQTIYLDPERQAAFQWDDFAPLALHVFDPGAIAVKADSKYQTLKDLVDDAKANPENVTASTTGVMGDDHLAILMLAEATGSEFGIVHFNGSAESTTALLGGHTDVAFNNVGDFANKVKDGTMRMLAVMDTKRSEFMPDVPTVEEAIGVKLISSSSRGVAAPAGTPDEIVNYLSDAWRQAMEDPDVSKRMAESGFEQRYMNPKEFGDYWLEVEETVKRLLPAAKATAQQ